MDEEKFKTAKFFAVTEDGEIIALTEIAFQRVVCTRIDRRTLFRHLGLAEIDGAARQRLFN